MKILIKCEYMKKMEPQAAIFYKSRFRTSYTRQVGVLERSRFRIDDHENMRPFDHCYSPNKAGSKIRIPDDTLRNWVSNVRLFGRL